MTYEEEILNDRKVEREFINALGKNAPKGMGTELDAMIAVYNIQLDAFVKNRFDLEVFKQLAEIDPEGGKSVESPLTYKEKVKSAEKLLASRHITLAIVREQILLIANNDKSNGQKK